MTKQIHKKPQKSHEQKLIIQNIDLAASLKTAGAGIKKVQCNQGDCVFVFDKTDSNSKIISNFENDNLQLNPRSVLNNRKLLLRKIKNRQ